MELDATLPTRDTEMLDPESLSEEDEKFDFLVGKLREVQESIDELRGQLCLDTKGSAFGPPFAESSTPTPKRK